MLADTRAEHFFPEGLGFALNFVLGERGQAHAEISIGENKSCLQLDPMLRDVYEQIFYEALQAKVSRSSASQ